VVNYLTDGRDAALAEIGEWLKAYSPPASSVNAANFTFSSIKNRDAFLKNKLAAFGVKCRVSFAWRDDLTNRLGISNDDIVRATNTIIELLERELSFGGTVRLTGFGDFVLHTQKEGGIKMVRFNASESWKRELNAPLYAAEIGLKQKFVGRKLTRRAV
jgi:hypothetical protein